MLSRPTSRKRTDMHAIPDQPFDAAHGVTVLVTGGAGFIGTSFVHMLAELRP